MALAGNWAKVERYARLGQLGGYQNKSGKPFTYKPGMPKLTPTQQLEVLALYQQKVPNVEIAARYGISPSYVCKLAARRNIPLHQSHAQRRNKALGAYTRDDVDTSLQARMKRLRAKLEN